MALSCQYYHSTTLDFLTDDIQFGKIQILDNPMYVNEKQYLMRLFVLASRLDSV
jgi:hypothetical protein